MNIGFVGLGRMGTGMAMNLLNAGHSLAVYNRTPGKGGELGKRGARVANSPADAARNAEVLLTMLANDEAAESVTLGEGGVVSGLGKGSIHVSTSTISPALSQRLANAHRERGQEYVAAPVLGRPDAARQASLLILAAGPANAAGRCRPVFEAIGRKTIVLGEKPEQANVAKLAANFVLAAIIEAMGEAYAVAEPYAVSDQTLLDILSESILRPEVISGYGKRIAERDFQPAGFQLRLGLKDIHLVLDAGESVAVPMPTAGVLRERFVEAMARGMQDADWSAVARPSAGGA